MATATIPQPTTHAAAVRTNTKTIKVEIKRQASPDSPARTEHFEVPYRPNMNITSLLGEIAQVPVMASGEETTSIAYDANCLEEICGSCAMLINGKARMACSSLVDKLDQPIRLAPLSKFPVVRDLAVDRSVLFQNLKAVKAWVPIDGTYDLGAAPRQFPQIQEAALPPLKLHLLHHLHGGLPPVQRFHQLRRRRHHRAGQALQHGPRRQAVLKEERLRALAGDGGVPGVRHGPELRRRLPQAAPPHRSHLRRQPRRRHPASQRLLLDVSFAGVPDTLA